MSANSELTVAVHALCWLETARREGQASLTSAQVAASLDSSAPLVRKALGPLRDAGLVVVTGRGPGSGWRLARSAREITLRDVHRAVGVVGPFGLHAHLPNQQCPVGFGARPVLSDLYASVESAMADVLSRHTIARLTDEILSKSPLPVLVPGS